MQVRAIAVLVSVFLLAGLVRFYHLGSVPAALNWDEVSHGYNAYSILKTGSDEWGEPWPVTNFRAYGDYPLPLNAYLTIPAILVFGLNAFAIRLPSALLGTLLIVPTYFLALAVTEKKKLALLSAVLLAVAPWLILPSRGVFQSTIALFFFTLSLATVVWAHRRPILFLPVVIAYALSAYAYHNSRILTFLFLPFFLVYFIKVVRPSLLGHRFVYLLGLLFCLALIPAWLSVFSPSGSARANWVFIIDQGAVDTLSGFRNQSHLPEGVKRLIYNRPIYFLSNFTRNYFDYFSPRFLFLSGGTQYQYSVPNFGLVPLALAPFFYLGLMVGLMRLVRGRLSWGWLLVVAMLVLGPIPAAMTRDRFQILRSSLMFPAVIICSVLGFEILLTWIRSLRCKAKPLAYFLVMVSLAFPAIFYLTTLFGSYTVDYSWAWQYGYHELVAEIQSDYRSYDHFYITKKYGEPHEFFLFYWPWDPARYKNDSRLVRYFRSDWFWVDGFDKFTFVNDWEVRDLKFDLVSPGRALLVTSPGNFSVGTRIKTINFLDGRPAFDIVRI